MLHENVIMKSRIHQLEEQVAVLTKRTSRKRKRIQHGGTIEYGAAALAAAQGASSSRTIVKKARSSGGQERAQPGQRHCGNCGKTGHNARTCQKDAEEDSVSDTSALYEESVHSIE